MAEKQPSLSSICWKFLTFRWNVARNEYVAWSVKQRQAEKELRMRTVSNTTSSKQISKMPKQWKSKYSGTLRGYLVLEGDRGWKMQVDGYYTSREMSEFGFSEPQIADLIGQPYEYATLDNIDGERSYVALYPRARVDSLLKPQAVGNYKVRLVAGNSSLVLKVDGYITEHEVMGKGFTRKEIAKFIGEPDAIVALHGVEANVYTPKWVDAALESPDLLAAKAKRLDRNAKNRERAAKKREEAAEAARIADLEAFEGEVYTVTFSYHYGTQTYALLAQNPEDAQSRASAWAKADNLAQQLFDSAVADYKETMQDYREEFREIKRDFGPYWNVEANSDIIPVKPVKPKRAEFNLTIVDVSVSTMPRNELLSVSDVQYVDETGGWDFDIYPDMKSHVQPAP